MGLPDSLRTFANVLEKLGGTLALIAHLTNTTTDDRAVDILRAIGSVIGPVLDDLGVKLSKEELDKHIASLVSDLQAHDAEAADLIKQKFGLA